LKFDKDPANMPILIVSSTTNNKLVHAIRQAFNDNGFSKITMHSIDCITESPTAPQLIGYENALRAVGEKHNNALNQMNNTDCIVISVQDFIAEITTEK
jgi:non-canonical (house-cleaning) NTP pyrophosphatase